MSNHSSLARHGASMLLLVGTLAAAACSSDGDGDGAPATGEAVDAGVDAGSAPDAAVPGPVDAGTGDADVGEEACAPGLSCTAVDRMCIGLVDNAAATRRGLRMNQIGLMAPSMLASGLLGSTLGKAAGLDAVGCNLTGTETWSWLLAFDSVAGTLKTGGARPVADRTAGYAFDDETLRGIRIQPLTKSASIAPGAAFDVAMDGALAMPIFLGSSDAAALVLPLRNVRLKGTLSASGNCIGSYNAAGLEPTNLCQPDATHSSFVNGGSGTAFILLEDADTVVVQQLNESLCVLLSGDAARYGDGAATPHCKRTSGAIDFAGDWCSTTNTAASASCHDAVAFRFDYAAGSVKITN